MEWNALVAMVRGVAVDWLPGLLLVVVLCMVVLQLLLWFRPRPAPVNLALLERLEHLERAQVFQACQVFRLACGCAGCAG